MKGKTKFKSIFIKTAAMFFTFYLIVMTVFTVIYYKANITQSNSNFSNMLNILATDLSRNIYSYEYESLLEDSDKPWEKDENNLITNLNTDLSRDISFFGQDMFAKGYLYDEDGKMFAKSRNLLRVDSEDIEIKGSYSWDLYRYIDLDKYFSDDEIIELHKLKNQEKDLKNYYIEGEGYVEGTEIIPEVINVFELKHKEKGGEFSREYIKTYKFNVQEVEGLRKIDINCFLDSFLEIQSKFKDNAIFNANNNSYKKNLQRYKNFNEYSQDEIKSLKDESGNLNKCDTNETFTKVNHDCIYNLLINNHYYYLALKADYYPWEDILPKAIPLYLISFIMVLAMTVILSKGLYKTYEKQEALEKNRRELTSAIAHELKTPLGIIRTYGEGLKEKIAEDKKDYYLDVIIDETYKMDKMVLEMLDLSKLEAKAYELKKETFCINDLIEEIIKKNEKLFSDKNICINYTSDKKYNINADYYRVEQVINNLISNSIYHTDENKTVNITLYNQTFNVENEGEHIPKDKINLVWDAFYRVDNSRERSERRTGIGLAIVKNVLQLHNMEFGVENTNLGVKFWFKI